MFTGIVEGIGLIDEIEDHQETRRFYIEAPELAVALEPGASVAVDGACLTVTSVLSERLVFDVIGSTLERTIAGTYEVGRRVNLERAVPVDGRIDGHIVQGHVDSTGSFIKSAKKGEYWMMDFSIHKDVHALTISQGSITINGVSLTVSQLGQDCVCQIGVIPFTFQHTNLSDLKSGDCVNIEGDLIGKYINKILSKRGG